MCFEFSYETSLVETILATGLEARRGHGHDRPGVIFGRLASGFARPGPGTRDPPMQKPQATYLEEPAWRTPVIAEAEVLVLGGGPAGLAAAAAAARAGCRTLLVERYGFLGGTGHRGRVTNFCGLYARVQGELHQVVHGLADELLGLAARWRAECAACAVWRQELRPGLRQRGGAEGGGPAGAGSWRSVVIPCPGRGRADGRPGLRPAGRCARHRGLLVETLGPRRDPRRVFIDARAMAISPPGAGAPFEKADGTTALSVDDVPRRRRCGLRRRGLEPLRPADGRGRAPGHRFARRTPIIRPQKHTGEWRANVTQLANADGSAVDGTDAWQLSAAEVDGRRQIVEFMRFLRGFAPGFENAYLLEIAPQVASARRAASSARWCSRQTMLGCASFDDLDRRQRLADRGPCGGRRALHLS